MQQENHPLARKVCETRRGSIVNVVLGHTPKKVWEADLLRSVKAGENVSFEGENPALSNPLCDCRQLTTAQLGFGVFLVGDHAYAWWDVEARLGANLSIGDLVFESDIEQDEGPVQLHIWEPNE